MFTLPELPYAHNALEPYIDEATMKIHHDLHHGAYVKNLNDALAGQEQFLSMPIEELLKNLDAVPENIRTKVRNNGGGHYNHSLFWTLMSPTKSEPQGKLLEAINVSFGDVAQFQEKFSAAGMGRFGSGWVWLVGENGALKIEDSPNQDSPIMDPAFAKASAGKEKTIILGLDVWEHAYYLKYQNKRADYIKNWWNVVNWEEVRKRFEK